MSFFKKLFSRSGNPEDSVIRAEQKEGFTEVQTGGKNPEFELETDSLRFLPVIRNFDDENELACQTIVHRKLGEYIGMFAAKVDVKPNGRTGIDYVLKSHLEAYRIGENEVLEMASQNLGNAQLKIEGMSDPETGDVMISVNSGIGLATSILADHRFIDKLQSDLQTGEMHITIVHSGMICFTTPGSSFNTGLEKLALENSYKDVLNILSAKYVWQDHQLQLVQVYKN